jgi:hypothetical protein
MLLGPQNSSMNSCPRAKNDAEKALFYSFRPQNYKKISIFANELSIK